MVHPRKSPRRDQSDLTGSFGPTSPKRIRETSETLPLPIVDNAATIPVFDPNEALFAAYDFSAKSDPWRPPCLHEGQSRLPQLLPGSYSHALATAIRQAIPLEKPDLANTGSTERAQIAFHFRPDLMHSTNVQYRDIVHRIAHFGAYRCASDSDPPPLTVSLPLRRFPSDWWIAPGHLNPSLLSIFQEAYRRNTTQHALTNMTQWFQGRAATALLDNSKRGPPGRIHSGWFTPSIMSAILSFAFKPGKFVTGATEPTTIITPWHFIRSTPENVMLTHNRIPQGGLPALQIFDIIHNIIFLFHLCFYDIHDTTALGPGHSAFSRFSPLAGRLMLLADLFSDRSFQTAWDKANHRESYTQAV